MITEKYVSLETAKLLKERGFDEKCMSYYGHGEFQLGHPEYMRSNTDRDGVACNGVPYDAYNAPTLQRAIEWLEVEHGIFITVRRGIGGKGFVYTPYIFDKDSNEHKQHTGYDSRAKAEEAAIRYCVENLI